MRGEPWEPEGGGWPSSRPAQPSPRLHPETSEGAPGSVLRLRALEASGPHGRSDCPGTRPGSARPCSSRRRVRPRPSPVFRGTGESPRPSRDRSVVERPFSRFTKTSFGPAPQCGVASAVVEKALKPQNVFCLSIRHSLLDCTTTYVTIRLMVLKPRDIPTLGEHPYAAHVIASHSFSCPASLQRDCRPNPKML